MDGDGYRGKDTRPHTELAGVAHSTIAHMLQKYLKVPSRSASMKPLLTENMKLKRLAFAKKHKDWTKEDWSKVMISDKSTFGCVWSIKPVRPEGNSCFDSQYTVKMVKHPDSFMVWGCFSGVVRRGCLLPSQECDHECREV
jgi:hypothetical protein